MRYFRLRHFLAVLLVLVGASACDGALDRPTSPSSPSEILGIGSTTNRIIVAGQPYTLANDPLIAGLLQRLLSTSVIVGPNGGFVSLLGHRLDVPVGAVLRPTLFGILALPTGAVTVDLTAIELTGLLRRDVGGQGFPQPVRATLTYSRSTNVPNPSQLVIIRLNGTNGPEVMPSQVDARAKTVTAELDHFSRYAVAYPD